MVKKNDQIQLNITSVTSEGAGVGKLDNFTIFVANTAPGDLVLAHVIKVNKTYAIAKLLKIITPSDKRIENTCSVFLKCGGCCFRHIDYKEELNLKQQMVTQNLKKLGNINFQCEKINSFNFQRYRNKAQYPIGQDENGNLFAGFYATHSHRVIECQDCLLQPEIFNNITLDTLSFLQQNGVNAFNLEDFSNKKSPLIRHVFLRIGEITNEIMLCLVVNTYNIKNLDEFCRIITKKYPSIKTIVLNKNTRTDNVILTNQQKIVFGDGIITDVLCGLKFKISPLSFYQVNRLAAEKLYKKAKTYANLKKDETLLDLYCGAGTIGLSMADDCKKVIGCEIVADAIENAKENAQENNIKNAEFHCMDASKFVENFVKTNNEKIDVVVIDPPRKGCDRALLETIKIISPKRIVMISCNIATAARDIAILSTFGYEIKAVEAFDLFPRTSHVETCVLLSHKNS